MKTTVLNRQALDTETQSVSTEENSIVPIDKPTTKIIHIYCPDQCIETLNSVFSRHSGYSCKTPL